MYWFIATWAFLGLIPSALGFFYNLSRSLSDTNPRGGLWMLVCVGLFFLCVVVGVGCLIAAFTGH